MTYRLNDFDVPSDDIFRNDELNRRPIVEFLSSLISRTGGPFVIALDSPWGTGKTALIKMLKANLENDQYACLYFNAWEVDHITDPIVALVSSIDTLNFGDDFPNEEFKDRISKVKRITGLIAKRTIVIGAKAITLGALDAEDEVNNAVAELAGGATADIVDAFKKEMDLLSSFRGELASAIDELEKIGKEKTLIFFVDEMDRCRPTFAIELLERIKHLFDVQNLVFIISLDKSQLESSIAAVYGQGIDSPEYLRRFFDLEYALPKSEARPFVESLLGRFKLNEIFERRMQGETRYDRSNFIDFFSSIANAMDLSLRSQERCMTRLRVVLDQTPDNQYLDPILVAVLIAIRLKAPPLFQNLKLGKASASDVMAYLNDLPGGLGSDNGRTRTVIEAYLIASDPNVDRKEAILEDLNITASDAESSDQTYAAELVEMIRHVGRPFGGSPSLNDVISKIDLAADIRN